VELLCQDDLKVRLLSFIFTLGLLVVNSDNFVQLHVPAYARSLDFSRDFPLVVKLIAAHDNLLSFGSLRKRELGLVSMQKL
jgi:hypothetical protein